MLPGLEMMACPEMAVSMDVMQHVINVESSRNPYAIGVVGGALVRQPKGLDEALATVRMLEEKGYNFSIGLAQVNRYNLGKYGLDSYEKAFQQCPNLQAGSRILAECYKRSGKDWGKSFSCYYSGNFETGFRHGYVQKVFDSMRRGQQIASNGALPIDVIGRGERRTVKVEHHPQMASPAQARIVAQADGPLYVPSNDPARAYTVYPSAGAMARGSLVNLADQALSRVVLGSVDRMMQPQAQTNGGYTQQAPQDSPLQSAVAGQRGQPMMPQQLPGVAAGGGENPVMLQPWGQQGESTSSSNMYNAPVQPMPAQQIPPGDAAFVF